MPSNKSTPHDAYWSSYRVGEEDLDFLFNLLLEREKPLTPRQMVEPLVRGRLEQLEAEAEAARQAELPMYRPRESYEVGTKLVFPALEGAVGTVVGNRPGENPELGSFEVLEIEFENGGGRRHFAGQLAEHRLNESVDEGDLGAEDPVTDVLDRHGERIETDLIKLLGNTDEIVRIAWRWFPRPLLAEISEGHLNLAEAALDVAEGGPLTTEELSQHIELPENLDPLLAQFSVDYALQEDERFDEVGPAGEILWYLKRLEPDEVLTPPPRLAYQVREFSRDGFTEDLLELEQRLEDEFGPEYAVEEPTTEVTFPLLFPHWRVGALPLSPRLRRLFPTAYEAPRIRFRIRDGHSDEMFPGWVVREQGYVFGLSDWYRKYEVPAGGLVQVRASDDPGVVIVEVANRRGRSDWVRTVSIAENGNIGFTMLKQPMGTSYDDLMVIGLVDAAALDEAWLNGNQRNMNDERLVGFVFRELAKLNPQSAVHAKSLYSAVNVFRRLPPGPIFAAMVDESEYEHVGDLYWRVRDNVS